MRYSLIIFDLYNTLVLENPKNPFYKRVTEDLAIDHDRFWPEYRALGSATMRGELFSMADRIAAACDRSGQKVERAAVQKCVNRLMPIFYDNVEPYNDTEATLDGLAEKDVPLALLSNASSYTEKVLDKFALRKYFAGTILSYHVRTMKPDPDIYNKMIGLMAVSPSQCLFVGDGADDELLGAKNVGMTTVLVDRQLPHTERAAAHARYRVNALGQIAELALH